MKKYLSIFAATLIALFGFSSIAHAQATEDITITVALLEWYDISLSATDITFDDVMPTPSQTPGTTSIAANENAVDVRVFALIIPGSSLSLTVRANGDLTDGGTNTIGIGAVSWTVTGAGYVAGTMSTAADVAVGSWAGIAGVLHWHEGTFSYFFERDYENQVPATYTATATYTLSAI